MTDGAQETECVHLPDLEGDGRGVLFEGEPKTVRLALDAGDRVPPHQHPDRDIVCYVVDGELEMTLGDETVDLVSGDAARFSGDQDISPEAREDSVALLVLAER
ncbi:cupin domain-containing protein [Halosimplex aquaticum]|uniref:Cupin domain-containing protein n=1 Tax=Halosimplex aquaticum TaxID=3026162 RepID=A0ABD5XWY7_9EURY|nr:cupin domain-containing protein [Halosimplex aquaticum]